MVIIIVGRTCSGKTYLANKLGKLDMTVSKSYTTRSPRRNEEDYVFVSEEEFEKLRTERFFFETTRFSEHSYGTPYQDVKNAQAGYEMVFVVDPQGAKNLKRMIPDALVVLVDADFNIRKHRYQRRGGTLEGFYYRDNCDRRQFSDILADGMIDVVVNGAIDTRSKPRALSQDLQPL